MRRDAKRSPSTAPPLAPHGHPASWPSGQQKEGSGAYARARQPGACHRPGTLHVAASPEPLLKLGARQQRRQQPPAGAPCRAAGA
eukprot:61087-Alexandrium_andersonii.AAC.1